VKQVLLRRGEAVVDAVPAPMVEPGTVLVRVRSSCISVGTEMSGLRNSGLPLWKLALKYPEHLKKTIETVGTLGVEKTWSVIQGRLQAGLPAGYSAAGVVIGVGDETVPFKIGDCVACAGAQHAHHAEIICVPANLTVRIPDAVSFEQASTVTLGAIAMQGVRRAAPTLGETFVVIGLGVLGQLTVQLLRANGCRVIGMDLDRSRIAMASGLGMECGLQPDDATPVDQVTRLAGGSGADGVIITAASSSSGIVSNAFKMCRKKGRVVLVGDVGLQLNRADIYEKELDFFVSTSYGPGRYDAGYEQKGLDYPIGYVRWTENRNMQEYLRLIADQRLEIAPLVSSIYPVDNAPDAYAALAGAERPLMVLLNYPDPPVQGATISRVVANPRATKPRAGAVRVALVGAGGFAKGMHLPNLQALSKDFHLRAVVSRSGHNAAATARQWGADFSTTDFDAVLKDSEIDAVIIATRHNLHAQMALDALAAGKHVLLEKPLATTAADAGRIRDWYASRSADRDLPILLTGFNRRFSPHVRQAAAALAGRSNPMVINYRMNAGHIPLTHWVHGDEGGGRNIGEACHLYDLFTFLTDSEVKQIQASALSPRTAHYSSSDNFVATVSFADGSVATLTYTALGTKDFPKEQAEIFCDGKVIALDDYKTLTVAGGKATCRTKLPEKGQKEELRAFAAGIRDGEWPIPLWQQLQATDIALAVDATLKGHG
jgi:predicted dehydrogenase/threonine dehydrogenase-like Zn-dependent dehydrogenase